MHSIACLGQPRNWPRWISCSMPTFQPACPGGSTG